MNDFTKLPDLASERLGGKVLVANDEFFAPKENLLKESKPIFVEGKYTSRGKWMDGWETRRRRTPGYDWCILRLGLPGTIRGVLVDTSFFKGNYPEHFSLEACNLSAQAPYTNEAKRLLASGVTWVELLPKTSLKGDSQNMFDVAQSGRFTHVRLNIYPDGGVARLRLHGEVAPPAKRPVRGEIDLVAVQNGGTVIASSDEFFGEPKNLLMPRRGKNMGDGWETRRRRGPGYDWVVLKLGLPGRIHRVEVDTAHFKGNYPDSCSLEICNAANASGDFFLSPSAAWEPLLAQTKLKPNARLVFRDFSASHLATHARFNIYPDGGVSRLRLFGRAAANARHATSSPSETPAASGIERLNRFSPAAARKAFRDCCGSKVWANQMLAHMPFASLPAMLNAADDIWRNLDPVEWREAFAHHPAIGANRPRNNQSAKARQWSAGEQAAAQRSSAEALDALAAANRDYYDKFGHVFLICATGKTSDEILQQLQLRLRNDPDTELRTAAEEQRKITRLRLEKLLAS